MEADGRQRGGLPAPRARMAREEELEERRAGRAERDACERLGARQRFDREIPLAIPLVQTRAQTCAAAERRTRHQTLQRRRALVGGRLHTSREANRR